MSLLSDFNFFKYKSFYYFALVFFTCITYEMFIGKVSGVRLEFLFFLILQFGFISLYIFKKKFKLKIDKSLFSIYFFIYFLTILMSFTWSVSIFNTLFYSFIFFTSVLFLSLHDEINFDQAMKYILFLIFCLCVVSWFFYLIFGKAALSDKEVAWRLKGILGHEQRLAIFISIGIILFYLERIKRKKNYSKLYISVFIVTLLATQARAFIAFAVITVSLIYFLEGKFKTKISYVLFLGVIASTVSYFFYDILDIVSRGDADLTLTGRIPIWEHVIHRIEENPLLGFGFASFLVEGVAHEIFTSYSPPHAHNTFIHSTFEVGIIGTITLSLWMISLTYSKIDGFKSYSFYLVFYVALCGTMGLVFGSKINGCLLFVLFLVMIEKNRFLKRN